MSGDSRDPRSEAEKARAALMRNDAMGLGVPESPIEQQPSVTPKTFGDTTQAAQLRSGTDQGLEAGGEPAVGDGGASESLAETEQATTSRDHTAATGAPSRQTDAGSVAANRAPDRPRDGSTDDDALSRARE